LRVSLLREPNPDFQRDYKSSKILLMRFFAADKK
jgi:hypothetical protein